MQTKDEIPNFSFKGGDELNELPPLPYNPVRDKDSDWQPMIDVSDNDEDGTDMFAAGAALVDDIDESDNDHEVTDNGTTDNDEETAPAAQEEPEEAHAEVDEKEDPAEQHAVHGESPDSVGESTARHDGSGEQAAPGFCETQTDRLLENSSDATDGGRTDESAGEADKEAGAGETGGETREEGAGEESRIEETGTEGNRRDDLIAQLAAVTGALKDRGDKNDAVVSVPASARRGAAEKTETTNPAEAEYADDDDESAFCDDSEPEIVEGSGLGWKRKQLRQKAEKSGAKLIIDDEELTAIAAEYIDRRSFKNAAKAAAEAEEDDISDEELTALFAKAEQNKSRALTEQIAAGEGAVIVSADYLGRLIDRNSGLEVPETETDIIDTEPEIKFDDVIEDLADPDAPENEEAQNGEDITGSDGRTVARRKLFRPRGSEEVLDYDDVFQDDPDVTRKKTVKRKILRIVKEVLKNALIFLLVFALVIFGYLTFAVYVSRTNVVYGESMLPTLNPGDKVKTTLMPYVFGKPQVGDIVVIDMTVLDSVNAGKRFGYFARIGDVLRNNENISKMFFKGAEPDTLWIKRVVGVAGDKLEFRDNKFFRNGELVVEDYLNDQTVVNYPNGTIIEVREGYVFVMGDNRNVSNDSRNPDNGQIPIGAITGKLKG